MERAEQGLGAGVSPVAHQDDLARLAQQPLAGGQHLRERGRHRR